MDELHMDGSAASLDKRLGMPRHAPPAVRKTGRSLRLPQRDTRRATNQVLDHYDLR